MKPMESSLYKAPISVNECRVPHACARQLRRRFYGSVCRVFRHVPEGARNSCTTGVHPRTRSTHTPIWHRSGQCGCVTVAVPIAESVTTYSSSISEEYGLKNLIFTRYAFGVQQCGDEKVSCESFSETIANCIPSRVTQCKLS